MGQGRGIEGSDLGSPIGTPGREKRENGEGKVIDDLVKEKKSPELDT